MIYGSVVSILTFGARTSWDACRWHNTMLALRLRMTHMWDLGAQQERQGWLRLVLGSWVMGTWELTIFFYFWVCVKCSTVRSLSKFFIVSEIYNPLSCKSVHCRWLATIFHYSSSVMKQFILQISVKLIATQISMVGCLNFKLRIRFFFPPNNKWKYSSESEHFSVKWRKKIRHHSWYDWHQ